jgi:ubiquinone/menaquinone biosynthesis C-methylase UbiE
MFSLGTRYLKMLLVLIWAAEADDGQNLLPRWFLNSIALTQVAKRNLSECNNVEFIHAAIDKLPFEDESMDFAYSLGVLHHIPDTAGGIKSCVSKLKKNSPFLMYLYYAFDTRPLWFRLLWKMSNIFRQLVCVLPFRFKKIITDLIAALVYFPLARTALLLEKLGFGVDGFPLSFYRDQTFYTMRTDSIDRFGTRLEKRFTKTEISDMLQEAGLDDIKFSSTVPYWCVVGIKK